jgi:hypothetical protein
MVRNIPLVLYCRSFRHNKTEVRAITHCPQTLSAGNVHWAPGGRRRAACEALAVARLFTPTAMSYARGERSCNGQQGAIVHSFARPPCLVLSTGPERVIVSLIRCPTPKPRGKTKTPNADAHTAVCGPPHSVDGQALKQILRGMHHAAHACCNKSGSR